MNIIRFGDVPQAFDFTQPGLYQTSYNDNFTDTVPRTVRLPGTDGGFDPFGGARAPLAIGRVTLGVTLVAPHTAAMYTLRNQLRALASWGTARLYRQPADDGASQWCNARVNNITVAQNAGRHTDLLQPLQITWQVADPPWHAQGTESWRWGDGTAWGSAPWGGGGTPLQASGTLTDHTETVAGTFPAKPRILISPGAGQSCETPTVQRFANGLLVDEMQWTGTLSENDVLAIDTHQRRVTHNGSDAYTSFYALGANWFTLQPGDNLIRVTFANATDAAAVRLRYYTRWV